MDWILLLIMWFLAGVALGGLFREWRTYNRGRCRQCGQGLELVARDTYGRRCYQCPGCRGPQYWFIWPVDRKHGTAGGK